MLDLTVALQDVDCPLELCEEFRLAVLRGDAIGLLVEVAADIDIVELVEMRDVFQNQSQVDEAVREGVDLALRHGIERASIELGHDGWGLRKGLAHAAYGEWKGPSRRSAYSSSTVRIRLPLRTRTLSRVMQ